MALVNLVNDCIRELAKRDVEACKQRIVNEAQAEINCICNNRNLSEYEKSYYIEKVNRIASNLLSQQNTRELLLEATGFLNELAKLNNK